MRHVKWGLVALSVMSALVLPSGAIRAGQDDGNVVKWKQIIGFAVPPGSNIPGSPMIGGLPGSPFPWTTNDGDAWVNLNTGHVKFRVKGLVLAASTPLAVAGTIGLATEVKGTLVCNGLSNVTSAIVDMPAVPLDPQGNASFVGNIAVPTDCLLTRDKLAFLIRVADAENPGLIGFWIAVGVVRTP